MGSPLLPDPWGGVVELPSLPQGRRNRGSRFPGDCAGLSSVTDAGMFLLMEAESRGAGPVLPHLRATCLCPREQLGTNRAKIPDPEQNWGLIRPRPVDGERTESLLPMGVLGQTWLLPSNWRGAQGRRWSLYLLKFTPFHQGQN